MIGEQRWVHKSPVAITEIKQIIIRSKRRGSNRICSKIGKTHISEDQQQDHTLKNNRKGKRILRDYVYSTWYNMRKGKVLILDCHRKALGDFVWGRATV